MKILVVSDSPVESGFGRIANNVCLRLAQRGHTVSIASVLWDGVSPIGIPMDAPTPLLHPYPFKIFGLAGRDLWAYTANLIQMTQPDIVLVCQDFPYAQTLYYNCRVDWSRRAFAIITPVDGTPIHSDWLATVDDADATLVISRFGVEAMRQAGRSVGLCHPGVDTKVFKPATIEEKNALRAKAGIAPDAWLLGMMAMNQGRKAIPHTLEGFWQFAIDKPNAYLLLDMERVGAGGWDIPKLAKEIGIPEARLLWKDDLIKKGLPELRDRFCILDAHSVLAYREGFGLPLLESMACRIPTIAMDWCSGTEIVGEGKGYLVKKVSPRYGTWGNARDYDPDVADFVSHLNKIYTSPIQAHGVADVGYQWAKAQSWDNAANAVEESLLAVMEKRGGRNGNSIASGQPANSLGDLSRIQPIGIRDEVGQVHNEQPATLLEGSNPS